MTKKIVSINSEIISDIATFCPIMVVFGDYLPKINKTPDSYELHNMAHFEVQNYFRLDKTRDTLV